MAMEWVWRARREAAMCSMQVIAARIEYGRKYLREEDPGCPVASIINAVYRAEQRQRLANALQLFPSYPLLPLLRRLSNPATRESES